MQNCHEKRSPTTEENEEFARKKKKIQYRERLIVVRKYFENQQAYYICMQ